MGLFGIFAGKKPEDHEEKGDEYLKDKAFGEARIEFDKALHKIESRFPEKKHLADRISKKLESASESLAMKHIENAGAMAKAGDIEEAAELYGLALDLTKNRQTRDKIALAMKELGEKAAQKLDIADAENEKSSRAFSASEKDPVDGASALDESDDEELFDVLLNALGPETAEAYRQYGHSFARGYTALNRGDFELAIRKLSEAMEQNANQTTLIPLELATAYLHAEQHDQAQQILQSFVNQNPGEIRAYQLLCEIYWEAGKLSEAGQLLASAPEKIRGLPIMRLLDGETRFQSGDMQGARAVFQASIDENGPDEIVLRALAKTCEADGDVKEARELYAQIMNLCASCQRAIDPFIKRRYAELSLETGDTSPKLLDLFFSLVQEDPDHRKNYYLQIGRIYEKRGEKKEARRYLGLAGQLG
ncbi:MAG: tetratricopeptide repeat protein [Desulfosalsimonas sp.]